MGSPGLPNQTMYSLPAFAEWILSSERQAEEKRLSLLLSFEPDARTR
jgi:hypothetical protein